MIPLGTKEKMQQQKGFSLIELMVALTVFAIVMVVSIGTLLSLVDVNAKAQALYSATTNLSFALDSMTRELRTGHHYWCDRLAITGGGLDPSQTSTRDCNSNSMAGGANNVTTVYFNRGRDGQQIGYRVVNNKLEQKVGHNTGSWVPVTSDGVIIDVFDVDVSGSDTYADNGDRVQPRIKLFITGHVNNGLDTDTSFSIQTEMIQRRLDIK